MIEFIWQVRYKMIKYESHYHQDVEAQLLSKYNRYRSNKLLFL